MTLTFGQNEHQAGSTKEVFRIFFFRNYEKARVECEKDWTHAENNRNKNEMLISVDMQKVILLPRLPQYKRCLFFFFFLFTVTASIVINKRSHLRFQRILQLFALCSCICPPLLDLGQTLLSVLAFTAM